MDFWGNFLGGFFGRKYFAGISGKIFGRIFWEDFFGSIVLGGFFWEEFFGKNYLVEIKKEFMFLSRFWGNARRRKKGQEI